MLLSKKNVLFLILSLCTALGAVHAQSNEVGHISLTIVDAERNRNITTEVYYPAEAAGDETAIADGSFPVLVFGHGFLMSWESYDNFWTELVPEGYILCFPTTETTFTPNHQDFGLDLRKVADWMQSENEEMNSFFFNAIAPQTAIMGHSMGGGASLLAAENNSNIQTVVNFAAAETDPSAIAASSQITVPTLLFSGTDDCVTPPDANQDLMYESLDVDCKTQINILDGGHCYFANSNGACELGESFCNSGLAITREEQQAVVFEFLKPWLSYHLYNNADAWTDFDNALNASEAITFNQECEQLSSIEHLEDAPFTIAPNPVSDILQIDFQGTESGGELLIFNAVGQKVWSRHLQNQNTSIDVSGLKNGVYCLVYEKDGSSNKTKFLKVD